MPTRPEILAQFAERAELRRRFRVPWLGVFGLAVTDHFDPAQGDMDQLVELTDSEALLQRCFKFSARLEQLFERPVDLLMPRAIKREYGMLSTTWKRTPRYAA